MWYQLPFEIPKLATLTYWLSIVAEAFKVLKLKPFAGELSKYKEYCVFTEPFSKRKPFWEKLPEKTHSEIVSLFASYRVDVGMSTFAELPLKLSAFPILPWE